MITVHNLDFIRLIENLGFGTNRQYLIPGILTPRPANPFFSGLSLILF